MGNLKATAIILGAMVVPALFNTAYAASTEDIKQYIIQHSKAMGVEPEIMLSLANTESGFRQEIKAPCGTVGVFQLLPSTAQNMGFNAYNLDENIKGGITYYKTLYDKFGTKELALAAYNSGPDAIRRCNNKVPAYSERFVSKVIKDADLYKASVK